VTAPGLLAVHAHPDDEAIMTGGVLARAVAAGRRAAVVTCTAGERGEVPGAGVDRDLAGAPLAEVRVAELAAALDVRGAGPPRLLGYADSGMLGDGANDDPAAFWRADLDEAVGRLVAHIRAFRPAVVVTYDAAGNYGHPDHIQAHRLALVAVEAAASEALYPEAGTPWRTAKLYFVTVPKTAIVAASRLLAERGLPSPFGTAERVEDVVLGTPDEAITTAVDVRPWLERKLAALRCHASQLGPDSFFLNVPDDLAEVAYGTEWFVRHRTDVPAPTPEDDLFAGVAATAGA
jgi:N-acetyl-1-D-myo-inositol-2-amino-2-deoxy-alpha-D-glucopyranoside deacetylase